MESSESLNRARSGLSQYELLIGLIYVDHDEDIPLERIKD